MNERQIDEGASSLTYFAVLGVSEDAGQDEIEARYQELTAYLSSTAVPPTLRDWARRESELIDEAYAVLADPDRRAALAAPAPRAGAAAAVAAVPAPPELVDDDAADELVAVPVATARREERVSAADALLMGVPWKLLALGVLVGLAALGAFFVGKDAVPGLGGGGDDPPAAAQNSDLVPVDTDRVAELMEQVNADPSNAEALFELGEIYFLAGEWQAGIDWFTKLLELDPSNVHARTDVGTAYFNLGKFEEAKAAWLKALESAPDDVQVHYNLGFLYANVEPVDLVSARAEWQKVVELSPGSNLANTAQVHLEGLDVAASPEAAEPTPAPEG